MKKRYLLMAKETAAKGGARRKHRIGAVGIRYDGAIVRAANLENRLPEPHAHAECRVVKKLGYNGVVYVVRVLRSGHLALARPCKGCESIMRLNGVKRCYYSISDNEIGVIVL